MRMSRLRGLLLPRLLGVFALICQLLLPQAHAAAWAQRHRDPLLYAFCGSSPETIARLRASAADLPWVQPQNSKPDAKLDCKFCSGLVGPHLAGTTSQALHSWIVERSVNRTYPIAAPSARNTGVIAKPRGPPGSQPQ